jgi:hypothetical protein
MPGGIDPHVHMELPYFLFKRIVLWEQPLLMIFIQVQEQQQLEEQH